MFEIAGRLLARIDAGERIAVATAVSITGSSPRTVGTSMALTENGSVIGSISGGCVEGAVHELCSRVLETGQAEFARFGFSDEVAFSVGLSCGGRVEVLATVLGADAASHPAVTQLREAAAGRAARMTSSLDPGRLGFIDADGEVEHRFVERFDPPARLIIFGAVEFSVALSDAAAAVGYRVTVCDARSAFATPERFASAEHVVVQWPPDYLAGTEVDARTVICILTHDDRIDADLIETALAGPACYVGAMGSRGTHERRVEELVRRGIRDLDRLRSPIGLDLGASTPEETAVSIMSEVLAVRSGASGAPLSRTSGAIHGSA